MPRAATTRPRTCCTRRCGRCSGPHVKQAGSLVAPDRLRFDFVHHGALTDAQVDDIERLVNAHVYRNAPVQTEERSTEEADRGRRDGALRREVRRPRARGEHPGFSMELCGGTHCRATGDIGLFTIVQEGGVAAGVRRIEAITGDAAVRRVQERRKVLDDLLGTLNVGEDQALDAV
jgi:alanyl-tRNA synthetase